MIYLFIFVLSSGKEIFTSSTKRSTWNFFFDASWIQKRMDGSSSRTGWYRRPLIIIQSLGYIGRDCYRFSSTAQEKYSHTPCLFFLISSKFLSFLSFFPSFSQVSQKWNWYIDSGEKWMVRMEESGPRSLFTLVYRPVLSGSHFRTR